MKVGDLVQLSVKGNQLDWVRGVAYFNGEKPLYGVVVMKRVISNKSSYKIHWFHKNNVSFCNDHLFFYREILKQLK